MNLSPIVSFSIAIDLIILAALGYTATVFVRHRRLEDRRARTGFNLVLLGICFIAIFLAAEFATNILEGLGHAGVANRLETALHPTGAWLASVFGLGAICWGVIRILVTISALHADLLAREHKLKQELAERERNNDLLIEQDNLLNSIIDNLPVALLIQDRESKAERANRTFLDWYGLDAEALSNMDLKQKSSFHTGNDHEAMIDHDRAVLRTGETRTRRASRRFSDGEVHLISITKFPIFGRDGDIAKIGSVAIDLTDVETAESALEESEQRYRNAFEFAPYPMYIHDGQNIISANLETARTYGFDSPEAMVGFPVIELLHPEDRAKFWDRLAKLKDGGHLPSMEDRRVRRDGAILHVVQSGTPIPWRGGTAILGFNRDVTRERENEARLRQAQKMEAVGQLTAGIAHDFNNMLGIIIGNCEILEDRLGQGDLQIAAIAKSAANGARLTQRLLAFSRKQVLQPVAVDALALMREMDDLLTRTLGADHRLKIEAADDLWRCEVDVAQLESALINLAINGRDAMPDGGDLTISLSNIELDPGFAAAHADVRPGEYVMISVTDHGVGIAPEILPHIFEPFFTTKDMGVGSGLGLSMIYGFIKQSGGHVSVESMLGRGATVKLCLPRANAPLNAAADETPSTPIGAGETILLVEDNDDIRNMVTTMLAGLNYQVAQASGGEEALQRLGESDVDLVLTDIMLAEGMNGRELARRIHGQDKPVRIVFMSGFAEPAAEDADGLEASDQILKKPFKKSELARAIKTALTAPGQDGSRSI